MSGIEAIIMAGGKGTRLHPYTAVFPKPLMPVGDRPVLELILMQLRAAGIRSVCLAVNHLRHLIQAFFGDGSALGISIVYSIEDRPLGTGGPIGIMLDSMADDFLVLNGDLITNMSPAMLLQQHRRQEADATIATTLREVTFDSGVLDIDGAGNVYGYHEKPSQTYAISMGFYAMRRDGVRGLFRQGDPIDMPELLLAMIRSGRRVASFRQECIWLDIGRPDDYARAQDMISTQSHLLLPAE